MNINHCMFCERTFRNWTTETETALNGVLCTKYPAVSNHSLATWNPW